MRSEITLPGRHLKEVFPYHVAVNENFVITQLGCRVTELLPGVKCGSSLAQDWFNIEKISVDLSQEDEAFGGGKLNYIETKDPLVWSLPMLKSLKDEDRYVELTFRKDPHSFHLQGRVYFSSSRASSDYYRKDEDEEGKISDSLNEEENTDAGFSFIPATSLRLSIIFLVQPNIRSLQEMIHHKLAWSDFGKQFSLQMRKVVLFEDCRSTETIEAAKLREEALRTKQSLEIKRMFVRYVSHEIRTPLNTVLMGLELLKVTLADANAVGGADAVSVPRSSNGNPTSAASSGAVLTTSDVSAIMHNALVIVDDAKCSCGIAVDTLNDLLLYEKIEGGILVTEKQPEPALRLIYDAVKTFKIQASQANIELEFTCDPAVFVPDELDEPTVMVNVDKLKIAQVLRNLVSNAIKFTSGYAAACKKKRDGIVDTDPLKVLIHVSIPDDEKEGRDFSTGSRTQSQRSSKCPSPRACISQSAVIPAQDYRGSYIRVEVYDHGPGISVENQSKLFNQIVQFNPNKLQGGGGSGLGLYISKGFMDLHDGFIGVHSEGEGRGGSCFFIDIPILDRCISVPRVCDISPSFTSSPISELIVPSHDSYDLAMAGSHGPPSLSKVSIVSSKDKDFVHLVPVFKGDGSRSSHNLPDDDVLRHQSHSRPCVWNDRSLGIKAKKNFRNASSPNFSAMLPASPSTSTTYSHNSTMTSLHGQSFSVPKGRSKLTCEGLDSHCSEGLPRRLPLENLPSVGSKRLHKSENDLAALCNASSKSGSVVSHSPLRLLVVDDSPMNRKMMLKHISLAKLPYKCIFEAADGLEAVEFITSSMKHTKVEEEVDNCNESESIDAVLMDFVMPNMDGPTAAQRMRELGFTGPIVGITGNVLSEDREHFLNHGANVVLSKPLDINALVDALHRYTNISQEEDDEMSAVGSVASAPIITEALSSAHQTKKVTLDEVKFPRAVGLNAIAPIEISDLQEASDSVKISSAQDVQDSMALQVKPLRYSPCLSVNSQQPLPSPAMRALSRKASVGNDDYLCGSDHVIVDYADAFHELPPAVYGGVTATSHISAAAHENNEEEKRQEGWDDHFVSINGGRTERLRGHLVDDSPQEVSQRRLTADKVSIASAPETGRILPLGANESCKKIKERKKSIFGRLFSFSSSFRPIFSTVVSVLQSPRKKRKNRVHNSSSEEQNIFAAGLGAPASRLHHSQSPNDYRRRTSGNRVLPSEMTSGNRGEDSHDHRLLRGHSSARSSFRGWDPMLYMATMPTQSSAARRR